MFHMGFFCFSELWGIVVPKTAFVHTDRPTLNFLPAPYARHPFITITQNGQMSKFTKYGHVVYHLICFYTDQSKVIKYTK